MNSDKLKLFELLKVNEAAGTIHFGHRRMLVLDADAMGLFRKELIESVGSDRARRILTRVGYACGYRDALTTRDWQPVDKVVEWWSLGPRLHTLEGVVHVKTLHSQIDKARGVFEVDVAWRNSYEAEQHRTHLGIADTPVCWMLVGYASGHATAVFGRDVYCYEKECVGKGDEQCVLIARAADGVNQQMQALKADSESDGIQAELGCLLEALDSHQKELKCQQDHVTVLESQLRSWREAIKESVGTEEIVGTSAGFRSMMREVERVATSNTTVLICGETGTGKDLIARLLHAHSHRKEQPFIMVDCTSLPESLVESELFGHEKGSFTGAFRQKLGRFEVADGGTIFLDEVGELPIQTQAKFLRALQKGEFERVGGTRTIKVDVRVLAATHQPLEKLVAEGRFREDLLYRLNAFPIHVPSLRERPEDITVLTSYFVKRYRDRFRKEISAIDPQSLKSLQQYAWPGNVRELEHIIERAVLLAEGEVLIIDQPLNGKVSRSDVLSGSHPKPLKTLAHMEASYVEEVLKHTNGVIAGKGGAAEILGLPASTLRNRMKRLGLK